MSGVDMPLALPRPGVRFLLVAPHPDDVAYSCGGLVERHLRNAGATLLTVFGRSAWALPKDLRAGGPEAISPVRAAEDLDYAGERGIDVLACDLPDASLRGYDDESELGADPGSDPLAGTVEERIGDALDQVRPDVVVAPGAVGGHIDHLLVHLALRAVDAPKVLFYEDIPYSALHSLSEVERQLAVERLLRPAVTVEFTDVVADKVAGMRRYASQTDQECVDQMLDHARRIAPHAHVERYWSAS